MALIRCGECQGQVSDKAAACPHCGAPVASVLPSNVVGPRTFVVHSGKSAGLAAVLSFLWCGLGQIYNGQIGKGVVLGFVYLISWLLIGVLVGFITTPYPVDLGDGGCLQNCRATQS